MLPSNAVSNVAVKYPYSSSMYLLYNTGDLITKNVSIINPATPIYMKFRRLIVSSYP